jgi:hypothetical protein
LSDPKEHHDEPDELDLDAETVKDLEPSEENADEVRGGFGLPRPSTLIVCGCIPTGATCNVYGG